jgi:hypothetical protein
LLFYPRYVGETVAKIWRYLSVFRQCKGMLDAALAAPDRWTYSDLAIALPKADEFDALDLYHATAGGEAALARKYRNPSSRTLPRGRAERQPPQAVRQPFAFHDGEDEIASFRCDAAICPLSGVDRTLRGLAKMALLMWWKAPAPGIEVP